MQRFKRLLPRLLRTCQPIHGCHYLFNPLIAVVAVVAVFASEYFRTRGRNFATKADFESLQQRLRANTELVEIIKSEVGQRDWTKREWTNLRRVKLEALLDKMHECEAYLDRHRSNSIEGKVLDDADPGSELDTIQALYFAELAGDVGAFLQIYREKIAVGVKLGVRLMQAGSADARQQAYDEFMPTFASHASFQSQRNAVQAVKSAARRLLVDIMGVT